MSDGVRTNNEKPPWGPVVVFSAAAGYVLGGAMASEWGNPGAGWFIGFGVCLLALAICIGWIMGKQP